MSFIFSHCVWLGQSKHYQLYSFGPSVIKDPVAPCFAQLPSTHSLRGAGQMQAKEANEQSAWICVQNECNGGQKTWKSFKTITCTELFW